MFALVGQYLPPPPGAAPPPVWGDPKVVVERLGDRVKDVQFERETMMSPALSPEHYRLMVESTSGPVIMLVGKLQAEPERLVEFRSRLEALASTHLIDNNIRKHFLMTRATKN